MICTVLFLVVDADLGRISQLQTPQTLVEVSEPFTKESSRTFISIWETVALIVLSAVWITIPRVTTKATTPRIALLVVKVKIFIVDLFEF